LKTKELVRDRLGEDRTLILHSGDFLSPSYLSNRCKTYGRQMVDLFNLIGMRFVTLGNHEFDHENRGEPSILKTVLDPKLIDFEIVTSNIRPADESHGFLRFALWPEERPFAAVIGVAGKETIQDASRSGFGADKWQEVLEELIAELRTDARLSMLLVLSHCSRAEDRELQRFVDRAWRNVGFAYVLAGHDHDIHWEEKFPRTILSKNLSNFASVTAALIPKWIAAAPRDDWGAPEPEEESIDEDIRSMFSDESIDEDILIRLMLAYEGKDQAQFDLISEGLKRVEVRTLSQEVNRHRLRFPPTIERAVTYFENRSAAHRRPDFTAAYSRFIRKKAKQNE
jgi:hypothetical protein